MLMNQSVNAAQRATEITLVRQQIDGQADMLRALHEVAAKSDAPATTRWAAIAKMAGDAGTASPTAISDTCPNQDASDQARHLRSKSFVLDPDNALQIIDGESGDNYQPAGTEVNTPPYAKVQNSKAYGIWIEPSAEEIGDDNKVGAYVFRIRTCWDSPGTSKPMQIETVVRLYDVLDGRDFTGENVTPTPDPAGPPVITTAYTNELSGSGSSMLRCNGQYPLEEAPSENNILFGDSVKPGDEYGRFANCVSSGDAIYNCINYDALYNPAIPEGHNGNYRITIQYEDADCNSGAVDIMSNAYDYKLKICKTPQGDGTACNWIGGEKITSINGGRGGSVVFENIPLNSGDKFGIRWFNNRFIQPGNRDPDFRMKSIMFEEQL